MTAPVLNSISPSVTFAENTVNAAPQRIDTDVTFSDAEGNFNGGTLTLSGLLAEDRVSVRNEGAGVGQIGLTGTTVTFGGVAIGTLTGGVGSTLAISFNAAATSTAVDALIQNLTYANTSHTPTASRDLMLNVADAGGADVGPRLGMQTFSALTGAANPFNGIDIGTMSKPTFVDLDDDGSLELLVGKSFELRVWTITGSTYTEQTGAANPFNTIVGSNIAPTFVDLDGDGDLDLVAGLENGTLTVWTKDSGTYAVLPSVANPFNGIDVGSFCAPSFVDVDGDGDLDLVAGEGDGTLKVWAKSGSTYTEQTGAANPFTGIDVGLKSTPVFFDIDGDGDLDLISGSDDGGLRVWTKVGTTYIEQTGAANPFNGIDLGSASAPSLADLDGDGDLDLIAGELNGALLTFQNTTPHGRVVSVAVTAENDAPTGAPSAALAGGTEDVAYTVSAASLLQGFSDPDSVLSIANLISSNGTVTNNGNGTYTITPGLNFNGSVTLTYSVTDGVNPAITGQTRNVTLAAVNDAPTGAPTATLAGGTEDVGYIVSAASLLQGFSDVDSALSITNLISSTGTVTNNGNGTYTIAPALNFNGSVTLTYSVTDGVNPAITGQTRNFTVAAVNDAPTGAPTATLANGSEDVAYTVSVASLLQGFSDPDSVLSIVNLTSSSGTLTNNGNGTYTITPVLNFNGDVTLTYGVTDGVNPAITGQTRSVTIAAVNDAPKLVAPIADSTVAQAATFSISVASAFQDTEGGALSFSAKQTNGSSLPWWLTFTDGVFSGNAPIEASQLSIVVSATDGSATVTDSFVLKFSAPDIALFSAANDRANSLTGSNGEDVGKLGAGDDKFDAGSDNDTVLGGSGNDRINGGSSGDKLYGESGKDTLDGGSSNDLLSGGRDADVLTGGTGYDTFLFNTRDGSYDVIKDFSVRYDTIRIDNYTFSGLTSEGTLSSSAFRSVSVSRDSSIASLIDTSDRLIYNKATGSLLYDADGKGGAAAVIIADLATGLSMTSADFYVI